MGTNAFSCTVKFKKAFREFEVHGVQKQCELREEKLTEYDITSMNECYLTIIGQH